MARLLFISDLHLAPERPDIIQLFVNFLDHQATSAKQLYILGDFVEYWLGDDDTATGLKPVFDKMKQVSEQGLEIFLMHGNRDFLMGEELARRCGCTLIPDPYIIDIDNTPVILMHGDTLCTDDVRYQELRLMLRHPDWQKEFLAKPLDERTMLAEALRKKSMEETGKKSEDIMDVNATAVEQAFQEHQVQLMIHGHTHRPGIHQLTIDQQKLIRIVLGDWYRQGSCLELNHIDDYRLTEFH